MRGRWVRIGFEDGGGGPARAFALAASVALALVIGATGCAPSGAGAADGERPASGAAAERGASVTDDAGLAAGQSGAQADAASADLVVSAAASLAEPLQELAARYAERAPGTELHLNFGSSGTLQRQIELGAPTDVFVSAGRRQMDELVEGGWVDAAYRATLLTNRLVVVAAAERDETLAGLEELAGDAWRTVAIGEPETVPAGAYAREALQSAGVWEALGPKLLPAKDVRQALVYVETGNADAGLVYATDAASSSKVRVAYEVPAGLHEPIEYPIGVAAGSERPEAARALYEYLRGAEAADVFRRYGFEVPAP